MPHVCVVQYALCLCTVLATFLRLIQISCHFDSRNLQYTPILIMRHDRFHTVSLTMPSHDHNSTLFLKGYTVNNKILLTLTKFYQITNNNNNIYFFMKFVNTNNIAVPHSHWRSHGIHVPQIKWHKVIKREE